MFSILIPVYHQEVISLVEGLLEQARDLSATVEIRIYDDGSPQPVRDVNQPLAHKEGVVYRELPNNRGRSAIRNLMAAEATYDRLLFMDGDSGLVRPHFLSTYLESFDQAPVICGGRCYSNQPPANPALYLHWLYGSRREARSAAERSQKPWSGFMSCNFVMTKQVWQEQPFDDRLKGYGHEDTLLGLELQQKGIPILHIDNPLEHLGLETADTFLDKHRQAVRNLWAIYQMGYLPDTRLMDAYMQVYAQRVVPAVRTAWRLSERYVLKQLKGRTPSLRLFDFYRLGYLLDWEKTQRAGGKG